MIYPENTLHTLSGFFIKIKQNKSFLQKIIRTYLNKFFGRFSIGLRAHTP